MKIKNDFVTNSSSTSYMIKNVSESDNLTIKSFIESIWPHIQNEMKYYEFDVIYSKDDIIKSLEENYKDYFPLLPLQEKEMIWGDEHNNLAGRVFDYVLRPGIQTGLVEVRVNEYLR
jgi:hypothetical protein